MTETPECPYCGEEMELHHIPDGLWWYQCGCCGAIAPSDETPEQALAAALRRAEPENRVLTLGEIYDMTRTYDGRKVWEERKWEESKPVEELPLFVNEIEAGFLVMCDKTKITRDAERYGISWRCWLRKPTAEEMEREKWND